MIMSCEWVRIQYRYVTYLKILSWHSPEDAKTMTSSRVTDNLAEICTMYLRNTNRERNQYADLLGRKVMLLEVIQMFP
jgi:hypothetical protein